MSKQTITLKELMEDIRQNDPEHYAAIMEEYEKKLEKIKRGGKRAGSGRKKVAVKKTTISVVLDPELLKKIDSKRGSTSRSKYISDILNDGTA